MKTKSAVKKGSSNFIGRVSVNAKNGIYWKKKEAMFYMPLYAGADTDID